MSLALLPLPLGSRIGDVYQEIAAGSTDDQFVVQNGVEFTPPGLVSALVSAAPPLVYEVEARCRTLDATKVSLHLNLAQCWLKITDAANHLEQAIRCCDEVLLLDADNVKALYRRALAFRPP